MNQLEKTNYVFAGVVVAIDELLKGDLILREKVDFVKSLRDRYDKLIIMKEVREALTESNF